MQTKTTKKRTARKPAPKPARPSRPGQVVEPRERWTVRVRSVWVLGDQLHQQVASAEVVSVQAEEGQGRLVYEPSHPDANGEGYVEYPNISVVGEMTNMVTATRSYEANISAIQTIKQMAKNAFEIGT